MVIEQVVIGKNIIEILTTGMYHNPLVIYREYIQNSVDAINHAVELGLFQSTREGEVNITIDKNSKNISFYDNATGISANKSWNTLTSIAASTKDRNKNLGFRGIGRLAGLAYCEKLTIETSFQGEPVKSQLVWDGDKLRSIISNTKDQKEAHEVINSITTFRNDLPEEENKHYFTIKLENIKNIKLLDISEVEKYCRMVAPVSFLSHFYYQGDILNGLNKSGAEIGCYRVFVNNNEVFKPYRVRVYKKDAKNEKAVDEIIGIEFFEVEYANKKLAIGWYALTKKVQRISSYNEHQGIRIRKGNIQIGDQFTMQRFFSEERFHNHFIGEVHVISPNLIPNGQRDYFDESEITTVFEQEMKVVARKLSKLCHSASEINSSVEKIDCFSKKKDEFNKKEQEGEFISEKHIEDEKEKLEQSEKEAKAAKDKLRKIIQNSTDNQPLQRLLEQRRLIESSESIVEYRKEKNKFEKVSNKICHRKNKYKSQKISSLNKKEQKLIGDVYDVIRMVLTPDLAQNLILKIESHFIGDHDDRE